MPKALIGAVAESLRNAGLEAGDRVVVAVSGGVDSMTLLHVLARLIARLPLSLHVAHIHHGLRGRTADLDAALVAAESARHGLPVTIMRLAPEKRTHGVSVQVWAREARYASLEDLRRRVRGQWIATAHTQNDQAETVLLNLLRGTGLRGLAGIPRVRDHMVRPLLGVSRAEIAAYAKRQGVLFREDPSNTSSAYRRNRIRHRLLPLLARQYNPRIVDALAGLATQAREDDDALAMQAQALAAEAIRVRNQAVGASVSALRAVPPAVARRLLLETFRRAARQQHGLTRRHLAALSNLVAGAGTVGLPGALEAWSTPKYLWVGPGNARPDAGPPGGPAVPQDIAAEVPIRVGRWTCWGPGRCFVRVRRVTGEDIRLNCGDPCREILHPRLFDEPLWLRAWQPGDRFRPFGLAGEKKLQDFFVDAKIPRRARAGIPLLVAGAKIAWVVGHRIAEEFRWEGERMACLAEVRFQPDQDELPALADPDCSR